jgi:hypothetical protein
MIIPISGLRWLTTQPDSVVSIHEGFNEVDQPQYALGDHKYITNNWQGTMLRRDMNCVLDKLVAVLDDELKYAFDQRFGTNTNDWVELPILQTMSLIVAQGSSRFTVGLPHCKIP